MPIKIKRLSPTAIKPTYGSEKAACFDLYADSNTTILPHTTSKIGTGWAMQSVYDGYVGLIFARSGLATKQGLRPANCVGVVDEDYTGEIIVALHNDSNELKQINKGDRIAQMMFVSYQQFHLVEVEELDETERGSGGFGSTGK